MRGSQHAMQHDVKFINVLVLYYQVPKVSSMIALNLLSNSAKLDSGLKIRTLTLPDRFIAHATPEEMYAEAELVKDKIVEKVLDTLNIKSPDLKIVDPKK